MPKTSYRDWNPSLDNGDKTMQDILDTLPANPPEDISKIVKLFENPDSPLNFVGAVNLERHDCIHIILGRGLLPQDEAFVIGFTMGTSKDISKFEEFIFKKASMYLYPKKYRFTKRHMRAYDLGLEFGKNCDVEKIYDFPFENNLNRKLIDLRDELKIDINQLKKAYSQERKIIPNSKASKRLP